MQLDTAFPIHWRSKHIAMIKEWFIRLSKIEELEELIHISQDWIQKFVTTWTCWTHFKTTECYRHYVP